MLFLFYCWCLILEICENVSLNSNTTLFSINSRNFKTLNELARDLENSQEARIKQSDNCTQDDIRDNIQCFLIVPFPQYVVELNQTIEMSCVISNQHGKVQWKANSDLLGYDRMIQGRPRYRIVGDPSKGEHVLQIKNVSIEDDGKYECQVQPIGIKHPALRRITHLTIIVLPEIPKIYFQGKHLSNQIVELSTKDQSKPIELTCISRHGRPEVSFEWYVNGKPVCSAVKICEIESLSLSVSKLIFVPNNIKTIQSISCAVTNSATRRYPAFPNHQTLKVIIQTPPNVPEIKSFTNEKVLEISVNESIKLFCHCTPPGFPAASLYWEWRWSNEKLNYTKIKIDGLYFTMTKNKISTISSLHLFYISKKFHRGFLHCIADHPTGSVSSNGVQIMIKYPPEFINITIDNPYLNSIYKNKNYIFLDENVVQKINCITGEYYGSVNLKWKMDDLSRGKDLRSVEKIWQIQSNYKQQSSVSVTLGPTVDEIRLNCVMFFMDQLWLKSTVTIMKIKRPERLYIENYQSTFMLEENQVLKLKCLSFGGRPQPDLQWILNGETIVKSENQGLFKTNNSVDFELKVQRIHNTVILKCETRLEHYQTKTVTSQPIKLTVVFPPLKIKIEHNFPNYLLENEDVVFNCVTTESNPPSGLIWKIKVCKYSNIENCTEHILSDVKEYIFAGTQFHGYKTKSILKLSMNWKYHLAVLICESLFSYSDNSYPVIRSQIQLFISFKPNFINIGNFSQILLTLDSLNQSIIVKTVANPLPIRFKWLFKRDSPSISTTDNKIFFQKVDESIKQEYQLIATNSLGDSVLIFNVDITYSPRIVGERFMKLHIHSKITELECLIESNPSPQISKINWLFFSSYNYFDENFDEIPKKYSCNQGHWKNKIMKLFVKCRLISPKIIASSLIIYNTSPEDVGTYICSASDNRSLSENKTIELITISIPNFISIPLFNKVAILLNTRSLAKAFMHSGLTSNITLHIELHLNKSVLFPVKVNRINSGIYLVTSEFSYQILEDIEKIYFRAENKIGSSSLMLEAVSESIPDSPIVHEIKFLQPNSLFVKIIQTFDGGYPQSFQVFWKEANRNTTENKMWEVPGDYTKKFIIIKISDTFLSKNYEIQVCSKNLVYGRCKVCPKKFLDLNGKQAHEPNSEDFNENLYELIFQFNLKIVISVAGFVFGLILLAIFIIIFLFKCKNNHWNSERRPTVNHSLKYGNDLLIPNLSITDSKSDFQNITSFDKTGIPLNPILTHCSQSKV